MYKLLQLLFYLLLTVLSTRHFLHPGFPVTHDGNNHLIRFANYRIAMREGQLPPRLAPNLVNGYGYPVFNYNYPLANILSVPFSVLDIHYESTLKILFTASMFALIYGADLWLKQLQFKRSSRLFALLLLAANPYLLTSIIYRGNIGEIMAVATLPWIFYFLSKRKFYQLTIGLTLLFLAHNIAALFAGMLIMFVALFELRKATDWQRFFFSLVAAVAMSLWFWLPALAEKHLITLDGVDLTLNFAEHFPTLTQLLRLPLHFGYSYWGSVDSMSLGLGLVQSLLLLLTVLYLLQSLWRKHQPEVWTVVSLVLVMAQLPFFQAVYELVPFASFVQFPWRMSLLLAIALIPVAALLLTQLGTTARKILWILLFLQIGQLYQLRPIDYQYKNPIDYEADAGTTSVNQENMPRSFSYPFFGPKQEPILILEGEGELRVEAVFGSQRRYQLHLTTPATIVESTAYFPGWQSTANDQLVSYFDNEHTQGRIAYQLPAGDYQVVTKFTQRTWPRLVGNAVSLLGVLVFGLAFYRSQRHQMRVRQAKSTSSTK